MASRTLLDELELPLAQCIDVEDSQALVRHAVPGLDGDLLQRMGRRAARVAVTGVVTGPGSRDGLEKLRDKLRGTEPVDFVADIATATRVTRVLVEELDVRELAGRPERFEYAFLLREYTPPPPPEIEDPPDDPPPVIDTETGTLAVEAIVEGEPDFDMGRVAVTAEGPAAGPSTLRTLTTREGNRWTETGLPPGKYVVRGAVAAPAMRDQAEAEVSAGQTEQATLRLARAQGVARAFVVTFRFDSAFVEPCMRAVLRRAAAYAAGHPSEHLVVLGHTDKAGSPEYNQSLSERRARAVFASLNFAGDAERSVTEWSALRTKRTIGHPTEKDGWGPREYQQMLQELGFYPGEIDGEHGPLTDEAVRAFRCRKGLPPGTQVDDAVWEALIRGYLADAPPTIPPSAYLRNCADSRLEWLGAGEQQPLKETEDAHRPSRRVELLFVTDAALPCTVPVPDTWALPEGFGHTPEEWCLGPGDRANRACFLSRKAPEPPQWTVEPADPAIITVRGTLVRETETDGVISTVPAANTRFVLIASDGEFKQSESSRGVPTAATTGADGGFTFPGKRAGVYVVEVQAPVLARLEDDPGAPARGPTVCKALLTDAARMNVVLLRDPVLREIRLPVIAHRMTALHPATRAVRTCPDALDPAVTHAQRTARDEAAVRALLTAANRMWGQARVRFELRHAVDETFATAGVDQCHVTEDERNELFADLTSPGFVNLFLFGSVASAGEAGIHVVGQRLDGAGNVVRTFECIGMGDRVLLRLFANLDPIQKTPPPQEAEVILAHELGHYLSLDHVTSGDTARRLMLPQESPQNRRLIRAEVDQARASDNARDCGNVELAVTGAVQIGRGGHRFAAIRDAAAPPVVIDARVPPPMLNAPGSAFAMTGGQPGASPTQRTVARAGAARTEVIARWTPAGAAGGKPRETYAAIHVLDFDLAVDGAQALGNGRFLAIAAPGAEVVVRAELFPALIAVPDDLAAWQRGEPTDDPLRRRVPVATAGETQVSVDVAGVTRSVTVVASTLALNVQGAEKVGDDDFHAAQDDTGEVTVEAVLTPPVPDAQVQMTGGEAGPGPRVRIVSKQAVGLTTVLARVGGAQQQASVQISSFALSVAGATEFGGAGSGRFIVVAAPGQIVTVTADIAPLPSPLPPNFVTWQGGQPVPGQPLQRRVPATAGGPPVTVKATMAGAERKVTIHVVTFALRVENATALDPAGGGRFAAVTDAAGIATVKAVITPAITPAPDDLVTFGGDPTTAAGPTARTFPLTPARLVTVTGTVAGVTRTVTVQVTDFALEVEGLVSIDGAGGSRFLVIQDPAGAALDVVARVTAPAPFPANFIRWTRPPGVTAVPGDPLRSRVPRTAARTVTVSATVAGVTRSITLFVAAFRLDVANAARIGAAGAGRFGAAVDATQTVTVTANLNPAPSPVPAGVVAWSGDPTTDVPPTQRTFSRSPARTVTVTGTVAGVARTVVVEVSALSITATDAVTTGAGESFSTLSPANAVTLEAVFTPAFTVPIPADFVQWQGGQAVPGLPPRRRVRRNAAGRFPVKATATATEVTENVTVSRFTLGVADAVRGGGPASTEFFAEVSAVAGAVVTVEAQFAPPPTGALPAGALVWTPAALAGPDALHRTVSRAAVVRTPVTGTLTGTAQTVTVTVVQLEVVFDPTAAAPPLTFVRYGLWNRAYDAAGDIRHDVAEADNFIGRDRRKFHFRVRHPGRNTVSADVGWRTLDAARAADDAPASQVLTLPATAAGSGVFISRAVMLVTDDTDRDVRTNSGLTAPLAPVGMRARGQSNHRLRRAAVDGFVRCEYTAAPGATFNVELPVFNRVADERRRVSVRVIRYTHAHPNYATVSDAHIAGQFARANARWNQLGIQIDAQATVDRPIPVAALELNHRYRFTPVPGANEFLLLADLIPITPDNTIMVVFLDMVGANAFTELDPIAPIPLPPPPPGAMATMGDRFFIFMHTRLVLNDETLAHEFHHALFNRYDGATTREFFTLNTLPPTALVQGTGITLPDARIYRRVQNLHSADPDVDPPNNNIINWVRRVRASRQPAAGGMGAATATTGNTLIQAF